MLKIIASATAVGLFLTAGAPESSPRPLPASPVCDSTLQLPVGFCATLIGESLGTVRHLVVAPNGDVIASIAGGRNNPGGVILLRDGDADGRWETRERFGSEGGTGIALGAGYLWFASNSTIYRWKWDAGQ